MKNFSIYFFLFFLCNVTLRFSFFHSFIYILLFVISFFSHPFLNYFLVIIVIFAGYFVIWWILIIAVYTKTTLKFCSSEANTFFFVLVFENIPTVSSSMLTETGNYNKFIAITIHYNKRFSPWVRKHYCSPQIFLLKQSKFSFCLIHIKLLFVNLAFLHTQFTFMR